MKQFFKVNIKNQDSKKTDSYIVQAGCFADAESAVIIARPEDEVDISLIKKIKVSKIINFTYEH